MIERFEVLGAGDSRPDAPHVIFCDGTDGRLFRSEADLELSHWRPNRTPTQYRAGTSTEICFRFLENPLPGPWTVAVNNHIDMDGILSVYTLVHSAHALKNRRTIIQAAEMGDFWGWGEPTAQRVFQGVTQIFEVGKPGKSVYEEAFRRVPALIDGTDPACGRIEESLAPLARQIEMIENGAIQRRQVAECLAHYIIPRSIAGDDDERAAYVPDFNELISDKTILGPSARNKQDAQRVCLVSTERSAGWFHDLYFPGYLWADTQGFWQVPGMSYHDGMRSYTVDHAGLIDAFERLQQRERGQGRWALGGTRLEFETKLQTRFPLVGRFVASDQKAGLSQHSPENVATILADLF